MQSKKPFVMTIFRWNPIRQLSDARARREYSTGPVTFVPKTYVLQRKRWLYNNLFILLAGLWALTVSHNIEISETDTKVKLKKMLSSSSLFLSHLIVVPVIIWKLHLHYSIVFGAIGMGIVPFFYHIRDPVLLSVVVCLRPVFQALFDVSATIYVIKLARICSAIQGNAVFSEILTMRSLIMLFSCTANIASIAWKRYSSYPTVPRSGTLCAPYFCERLAVSSTRLASPLSSGQNTTFLAVAIVLDLSGIILIAMYLKPISNLSYLVFSREPSQSNFWQILGQFKKTKSPYIAFLITTCSFMYTVTDDLMLAHLNCHDSTQDTIFVISLKEIAMIFGALICVALVDCIGCRWLYTLALSSQLFSYLCLVSGNPTELNREISYLVIYYVLCTSVAIEMSILQLLVVQTNSNEEVSALCFFYVLGDFAHILRFFADIYLCTGAKLWILIGMTSVVIIANFGYWWEFDENVIILTLYGSCSQLIKTPKETLAKPTSFDLKIVIEDPKDIRKVETFLQRNYTLKSRYLVPPPDDEFSDT